MRAPLRRFHRQVLALAGVALGCGACGHGSGPGGPASGGATAADTGHIEVRYRPNVRVVDAEAGVRLIHGISSAGTAFLLDGADPVARALRPGDVLLVKELLARKVLATQPTNDGEIVLLTEDARIGDAVETLHLAAAHGVRFAEQPARTTALAPSLDRLADFLVPRASAITMEEAAINRMQDKGVSDADRKVLMKVGKALIEDWDITFKPTQADGRVNLDLEMKRDVGGLRAVIEAHGYLTDFDVGIDIDVEQSRTEKLKSHFKNVNGVMNFKWEVATETPGAKTGDFRIRLPTPVQIPLYKMLDGFPLFLEIGSAIIVKPAFSGGKEYSRGAFRITYDGYQNFQAKTGTIDADGQVSGDIEFLEGQNIAPMAPMGIVVAFAAPRIELTFGFNRILKFKDMKKAAAVVDAAADIAARALLTGDQYEAFKASALGKLGLSNAIHNAIKSDAEAYIELISSAGMSSSGISAITPCTRHDIHLIGKVGVSAEAFGNQVGEAEKEIFKKDLVRIDPPGTHLCESVGT